MKHLKDLLEKKFERVQPKTKKELQSIIKSVIDKFGNDANLNFIDTSKITDMSNLFHESSFNGDISNWDTSRVTDMHGMFYLSSFNGDISKWDVSKVTDMSWMFNGTVFKGDISGWDTSRVTDMNYMFYFSSFNNDISHWNVQNVRKHLFFNKESDLQNEHCPIFNN